MATSRSRHTLLNVPASRNHNLDVDLSKLIKVYPDAPGFTCVGWARTQGRQCHNIIAGHNRSAACALLDRGTRRFQSGQAIGNILTELTPLVLCRRWHQNQAVEMRDKWARKVAQFEERLREAARRVLEDFLDDDNEDESNEESDAEDDSGGESEDIDGDSGDNSEDDIENDSEDEREDERDEISRPGRQTSATTGSRRIVTRKPAQGEDCHICYDPLISASAQKPLVWCRLECGINFHKECMGGWVQRNSSQNRPTSCPHWYVPTSLITFHSSSSVLHSWHS
jgi:hypothetical protein